MLIVVLGHETLLCLHTARFWTTFIRDLTEHIQCALGKSILPRPMHMSSGLRLVQWLWTCSCAPGLGSLRLGAHSARSGLPLGIRCIPLNLDFSKSVVLSMAT